MTNVMGPRQQRYLGDAPIDTMIGWVPQAGPVGLGVSIFSYNRQVRLGIASDQGLAPDPQLIVQYFLDEFNSLLERSRQLQPPIEQTASTAKPEPPTSA